MTGPRSKLRIGLIGYGTVGSAFARALDTYHDRLTSRLGVSPRITRVAVRNPDRVRPLVPGAAVDDDPVALAADGSIDAVVEATGCRRADEWLVIALARDAAVCTANKLTIASSPLLLRALAARHPLLHCEAAVAAGVPVVRALRDSLDGEETEHLRGVINGTSTFVLSRIESGVSFDAALDEAVAAGYAERDGAGDLDGQDAAAKLAILATLAWRIPILIGEVNRRGFDASISSLVSAASGRRSRVRLVAEAWRGNIPRLVVEPRILGEGDPLAATTGVINAVEIRASLAGRLLWLGPGAGGECTASGLLSDLIAGAEALRSRATRRLAA